MAVDWVAKALNQTPKKRYKILDYILVTLALFLKLPGLRWLKNTLSAPCLLNGWLDLNQLAHMYN